MSKQTKRPGPVVNVLTPARAEHFSRGILKGFEDWDTAREARNAAEGAMVAAGAVLAAYCGELRKGNIKLLVGGPGVRYPEGSIESRIYAGFSKRYSAKTTVTRYMRMATLMVNDGITIDAAYRATEAANRKAAKTKGKAKPGPKEGSEHVAAPKTGLSTIVDGKTKAHVLALREGDEPKSHTLFAKFAESIGERLTPEQKAAIVGGMIRVWNLQSAIALQLDK